MFCLHLSAGYRFISWIALSTLWTAGSRMALNVRNFHYSRACVDKVTTCWRTKVWRNISNRKCKYRDSYGNIFPKTPSRSPRRDNHSTAKTNNKHCYHMQHDPRNMVHFSRFLSSFQVCKCIFRGFPSKKIVRINNVAHAANFRGRYWSISAFHRLCVNFDVRFGSKNRNLLF